MVDFSPQRAFLVNSHLLNKQLLQDADVPSIVAPTRRLRSQEATSKSAAWSGTVVFTGSSQAGST